MLINSIFRPSDVLLCQWTPQIYLINHQAGLTETSLCCGTAAATIMTLNSKLNQSSRICCALPVRNYPTRPTQTKSPQVSINNQLKEVICTFEESLRTWMTSTGQDLLSAGMQIITSCVQTVLSADLSRYCNDVVHRCLNAFFSFFFKETVQSLRPAAIIWSLQTVCQAHFPNLLL